MSVRTCVYGFFIVLLIACKKEIASISKPSGEKAITDFVLTANSNPAYLSKDIIGVFSHDTISIFYKKGTDVTHLVPSINFVGASISPEPGQQIDFFSTVYYTVTAQDKSERLYTVIAKPLSDAKEIVSFKFTTSDNPNAFPSDIPGVVQGDSIVIDVPFSGSLVHLIPAITHTGKSISPGNGVPNDFTKPVRYTVRAEDSTTRSYKVVTRYNHSLYFGSKDGFIYSLDATTGNLNWKFQTGAAIESTPALYNGTIYIGSDDNYLYALDAGTGVLKWKTLATDDVVASPFVTNGVVYIATGGNGAQPAHSVMAINASTGAVIWNRAFNYGLVTSPIVSGDRVYVGDFGYGIYALDIATGATVWSHNDGIVKGSMGISGNNLFFSSERYHFGILDKNTGILRDSIRNGKGISPGITLKNGTYYVGAADGIEAIDSANLNVRWSYIIPGTNNGSRWSFSAAVYYDDMVYGAGTDNMLYAFNATGGQLNWWFKETSIQGSDPANPVVLNGVVFCGSIDGKMYAIDAKTGTRKWSFSTGAGIVSGSCATDIVGKVAYSGTSGHEN